MHPRHWFTLAVIIAAIATTNASFAQSQNLLINGGIEDPTLPSGGTMNYTNGQNIGTPGGWTAVGAGVILIQTNYAEPYFGITDFNAEEGLNSLDITGYGNTGPTSGVQQTVATNVSQTYLLSFYVGRADDNGAASAYYTTPSTVNLSINNGPLVSYTNANATPNFVNWQQFTTSFIATQPSTLLAFYNGTSTNNFAGLDNVVLTPAGVPETSTVFILTIGLVGGGALLRNCRKHSSNPVAIASGV